MESLNETITFILGVSCQFLYDNIIYHFLSKYLFIFPEKNQLFPAISEINHSKNCVLIT